MLFLSFLLPCSSFRGEDREGRSSSDLLPLCSLTWTIPALAGPGVYGSPPWRLFDRSFQLLMGAFLTGSSQDYSILTPLHAVPFSSLNPGSVGHPHPNLSLYCANREFQQTFCLGRRFQGTPASTPHTCGKTGQTLPCSCLSSVLAPS